MVPAGPAASWTILLRHDGPIHVSLPRPDFVAYLALAQDQIRRREAVASRPSPSALLR